MSYLGIFHCEMIDVYFILYLRLFEEHIIQSKPHISRDDVWSKCEKEFPEWFRTHVSFGIENKHYASLDFLLTIFTKLGHSDSDN